MTFQFGPERDIDWQSSTSPSLSVILLNTKRESIYENFPESKRVLEQITNLNKFEEKLKSILESKDTKPIIKNRKRILENNAGKIDGKTTERIVKMINKLKLKWLINWG